MLSSFNDHVYLIVQGDDNLFAVSQEYYDKFSPSAIQSWMKEIGMTYTNANKDEDVGYLSLDEVSFLKRKFKKDFVTGKYVAPLDLDSIGKSFNWWRESPTAVPSYKETVQMNMFELSLHGRAVFNKYANKILAEADTAFLPKVMTYDEAHKLVGSLEGYY
jgi:hypothetical protein